MPRLPLRSHDLTPFARAILGAVSLALASLGAAGCGAPPPPKKPTPNSAIDPKEQASLDEGRKKIDDANRAINEKKFDRARKLLKEAGDLHVESQRFEIEETTEKLDKREAKLWANEVDEKIKDKDCMAAFKQVAEPMKKYASEAFTRELRRLVGADAAKCLQQNLDEEVLGANYSTARKLATSQEVKDVIGPTAAKKLGEDLESTILDGLKGQIADDLKARRWEKAVEKIDGFLKKGDATDTQVSVLLGLVRDGIAPEIVASANKAIGQRDAPKELKQIDAQIKLVRWELLTGEAASLAKDRAAPEAVVRKHDALAVWVESQRLATKFLKTPEKRWTHGKVAVTPPGNADGESKRDVPHGSPVWILGTTKDGRSLLTDSDPGGGALPSMLDKVVGWAKADRLAKEATLDWVLPDDQLKGQRVWAPLRQNSTAWELGTVTEVSGKDISVKRIADDAVIKVTRKQLRTGRLAPGTKVLTFCTAKEQPAQIVEVMGNGSVKLKCDGGQEKEDVLPALRSNGDILPPTK